MTASALLLPGQGSQRVGMGRDLAERFPEVRELYGRADDLLSIPLSRLSWEGPAERLTATENAQPAILLHSYAVWLLVRDVVGEVVVAAGHSLGEFTAHLIAGTFDFPSALHLVRRRGELMARSGRERSGTMAAVLGMGTEELTALCREEAGGTVVPANFNATGQVVISGDVVAVERVSELAVKRGARRVIPLEVSGAFHSPLMADAREGLRAAVASVRMEDPGFPVVANATAAPVRRATEARATLVEQLTSPVRWAESVAVMREHGPERWLELGPGNVLSGLLRRIDGSLKARSVGEVVEVEALRSA